MSIYVRESPIAHLRHFLPPTFAGFCHWIAEDNAIRDPRMLLYENDDRSQSPHHILYTRYITCRRTFPMVYLMTLFAEWPEWMVRRLSIRRSARKEETTDKLRSRNYENPFFLDYTKHPTDITRVVKQHGVDSTVWQWWFLSVRPSISSAVEIVNTVGS